MASHQSWDWIFQLWLIGASKVESPDIPTVFSYLKLISFNGHHGVVQPHAWIPVPHRIIRAAAVVQEDHGGQAHVTVRARVQLLGLHKSHAHKALEGPQTSRMVWMNYWRIRLHAHHKKLLDDKCWGTENCLATSWIIKKWAGQQFPAFLLYEPEAITSWQNELFSGSCFRIYMLRVGAQAVVDSLQLRIVEQGLQVCASELLCRRRQLLHVHVSCQGETSTQSPEDLHASLLETWEGDIFQLFDFDESGL